MPLENLEEEGLEKNPNLELAQTKFLLSLPEHKNDVALKTKLLEAIKNDSELQIFIVLFSSSIIVSCDTIHCLITHFFNANLRIEIHPKLNCTNKDVFITILSRINIITSNSKQLFQIWLLSTKKSVRTLTGQLTRQFWQQ